MPVTSLTQIFEQGGHHTVESFLERYPGDVSGAVDALRRRFGPGLDLPNTELAVFVGRVQDAMRAADLINAGESPLDVEIPSFTGPTSDLTYTVIVSIPDPNAPEDEGRRIEVPITLPADEPLALEDLRQEVEEMLEDWEPARETIPGGPAADLIRRDVLIRSRVGDFGGNVAGIADIGPLAVYRRG